MNGINRPQNVPPIIIWVEGSNGGDIHYCPRCGAQLDAQEGFSPDAEIYICKECRQVLYGDVADGKRFPGVLWFCDGCGDLLNHQYGFNDDGDMWVCKKCGHKEHFDTIYEFQFGPEDQPI